jgi:hypothetical protein
MNKALIPLALIMIAVGLIFALIRYENVNPPTPDQPDQVTDLAAIRSFEDCAAAGYPVQESYPRQCRLPDGRVYAEELPAPDPEYRNATSNDIRVTNPSPGDVTGKSFTVTGEARGTWFFEASFPVEVLDKDGKRLAIGIAQAQGEWMTTDFVGFSAPVTVPESYIGPATLVLMKDNPSGDAVRDASVRFPITIEY